MNMISTGAFLNEMDASNKQPSLAEKFAAVWEKKNAKAARAGGVSLMALSLAACGSSSTTTTNDTTTPPTTPTTPAAPVAQTLTLTKSVDDATGGAGDDTINAVYTSDATPVATLSVGDTVDGGDGTDTIKIVKSTAIAQADVAPTGATVSNVEIAQITSGAAIVANTSSGALSGIETMNATSTGGATITAAATTDINLTDASTDTEDNGEITVNGGKDVTLTLTAVDAVTNGDANAEIVVGATTAAAGKSEVTHTGKYNDADTTLSDIQVNGGTSIVVTQNAGVTAAQQTTALTDGTNNTVTLGAIDINGGSATTAVTVTQTAAQGETDATDGSGRIGIANGAVTVDDTNAGSATAAGKIATVTLNSFGAATVNSGALTTLNLSGKGTSVDASTLGALTTAANSTLALNVDSLTTTGTVQFDADITTLNLNATGTASTINALTGAGIATLNVTGDAKVTLTSHTLAGLTTVNVTNTGGADMDGTALAVGTAFTGGAGADAVSVGATTKAITMGGGNDTVVYGGAVGTGGSVDGGDGVDKISMTFAEANAADASAVFNTKFTNFETLNLEDAPTGALDIDGLNNASTVILAAGSNGGTLNNLDSGGTVHIKANNAGTLAVNIDGAIAQAADVLNLKLDKTGVLTGNTITVANVETINIDGADTAATGGAAAINTVTLTAAAATTITVTGNNGLDITATGSTAVTTFDASAVVGNSTTAVAGTAATTDSAANLAVTYASLNGTSGAAVTIKGGAGNDTLTGSATKNDDTITGGAGNDTIQGGSGTDTLDGGAGTGDVVTYADVTAATSHGLANLSGMAINMSAAEVLQSTIASAMGGTVVIGGGAGEAGSALAAGTVGYLSTTAANSTATMVRDTITNFESVVGSGLADYIVGSATADTIKGGAGADQITGGAGADNFVVSSGLTADTIADFTVGSDNIHFDLSDLNAAAGITTGETDTLITFGATTAAPTDTAASTTVAIATIDDDASTHATVLNANVIILNGGATTFANVGAAVDAFESAGNFTITHHNNIADDDSFIFAYENSTTGKVHIAAASFENADNNSGGAAVIADNDLKGTDLVVLTGVTDVTTLTAGDFDFIA